MSKNQEITLWKGIGENDFIYEKNIESVDIAKYDEANMSVYATNVNVWRQLIRLSDSLKPVERRILYNLYLTKAFPGTKTKSNLIVGNVMVYHSHGDSSIYSSMVGMAQPWKKQVPLVEGKGNFGSAARPDMYAHSRYTGAAMSKYAKECFFDDYDQDCVETVFNSACDLMEPVSLPAKFPNILINGGMGIAFGNSFRIPPYNVNDIITVCKRVIENPETANVFMIPDLPSGCIVVDNGQCFHDIVETGNGVLKMRANAEIIEGNRTWIIKITSLPWMTSLSTIESRIVALAESGIIPLKDKQDHSYGVMDKNGKVQTKVDFRLLIDKSHDPRTILNKLYTMTDLQKSVSVDFKVVLEDLTIRRLDMRALINSWVDERRSYKRRLYNKRLTKISARIDLLDIMLFLLREENIEKTITIIKNSDTDEIVDRLMRLAKMTSYQASRISDMRLSAFTKDAKKRYKEERSRLLVEKDEIMSLIPSEKKIDKIIMDELEDLRKYALPRRSKIITESTEKYISDTLHSIVVSREGYLKKLNYSEANPSKNSNMGAFRNGDFPIHQCVVHNANSLTMYDTFGRYSVIPLHDIDSVEPSQYGHKVFDVSKLNGRIVSCMEAYDNDLIKTMKKKVGIPYLLTVTKRGYAKKTPMEVFTEMKNSKNIRAMKIRDDDSMIVADVIFDSSILIIYTMRGEYTVISMDDISEQGKDSMGLLSIKVADGDEVCGVTVIGKDDDCVVILSDKGMCKKVDVRYFGAPGKRTAFHEQSSLMTLDPTDSIRFISGMRTGQDVVVALKNNIAIIEGDTIPDMTKKAKGKKLLATNGISNIVLASVVDRKKR